MKIKYLNNELSLYALSNKEKRDIPKLWKELKNDYDDWLADVRKKEFGLGKSISELLEWKGMSTFHTAHTACQDTSDF